MADYKGEVCPVCNEKFKQDDDIVVCPDCGTPYHRACWVKVGHCVHEAEHDTGFEWQPAAAAARAEAETICPNCGNHNPAGAVYCNHCGRALPRADAPAQDDAPIYARDPAGRPAAPQGPDPRIRAYAQGRDGSIYRREIGPDDPIDGIKARDWASYVGRSSPYYLMQFFRMSETRRRMGVCFSAFFLGPIYFFYRKMWREGAFFTALTLLLQVPGVLALLVDAGVPAVLRWDLGWLPTVLEISSLAGWAVNVLMGLFAVYWYKQAATRRIMDIYQRIPEGPDRADALALTGGTSLSAVIIYITLYLAMCFALATVAGPYLQAYFLNMTL